MHIFGWDFAFGECPDGCEGRGFSVDGGVFVVSLSGCHCFCSLARDLKRSVCRVGVFLEYLSEDVGMSLVVISLVWVCLVESKNASSEILRDTYTTGSEAQL